MPVTQLLHALAFGPHVEIVEARLPDVHWTRLPQRTLSAFRFRRERRRTRSAKRCFTTCIAVDGSPTCGSLIRR
jgi:hypothetical protein